MHGVVAFIEFGERKIRHLARFGIRTDRGDFRSDGRGEPLPDEARADEFAFGHDIKLDVGNDESGGERSCRELDFRVVKPVFHGPVFEHGNVFIVCGEERYVKAVRQMFADLLLKDAAFESAFRGTGFGSGRGSVAFCEVGGQNFRTGALRMIRGGTRIIETGDASGRPAFRLNGFQSVEEFGSGVFFKSFAGQFRIKFQKEPVTSGEVVEKIPPGRAAGGNAAAGDDPVGVDFSGRTLILRRKSAQRLDRIAEEFHPAGEVVRRTVKIDDAAAPGKFTGDGGFVFVVVIESNQFFRQFGRRDLHSRPEFEHCLAAVVRAWRGTQ